jgi:hypothetical protein
MLVALVVAEEPPNLVQSFVENAVVSRMHPFSSTKNVRRFDLRNAISHALARGDFGQLIRHINI